MRNEVFIAGQGIAGSMLGWACEQAGIAFQVFDPGHKAAASRVGAGLVSPLTGQRLVPTWRFAEWRDEVLAIYRRLEQELNIRLVRELRVERRFRDDRQRDVFLSRIDRPEVAPWIECVKPAALLLRGALQVDTGLLIHHLRQRWLGQGRLREVPWSEAPASSASPVIWCTGAMAPPGVAIPWELSRGEITRGVLPGLVQDTVLNNGHWILPCSRDQALVGALFDRGNLGAGVTAAGQAELAGTVQRLVGRPMHSPVGESGLRVNVPDRRPVVGWVDKHQHVGVFGGLAAKGALWAPVLARQWAGDGLRGSAIENEARTERWIRSSDRRGHSS